MRCSLFFGQNSRAVSSATTIPTEVSTVRLNT